MGIALEVVAGEVLVVEGAGLALSESAPVGGGGRSMASAARSPRAKSATALKGGGVECSGAKDPGEPARGRQESVMIARVGSLEKASGAKVGGAREGRAEAAVAEEVGVKVGECVQEGGRAGHHVAQHSVLLTRGMG